MLLATSSETGIEVNLLITRVYNQKARVACYTHTAQIALSEWFTKDYIIIMTLSKNT